MPGPDLEEELRVDPTRIENQLAGLWRAEKQGSDKAVTKAALWNVVAHTWSSANQAHATEVLSRASASVPQRTIVVCADPDGPAGISSWISANCHVRGAGRQVCSEEVSIVASGDRVQQVAPLVDALLLPDMPVAMWWLGDLPRHQHRYAERLLEAADRLIVDSSHFESHDDLELVSRIAESTTTAPADLNWARIEEWRVAAAALFDPHAMRARMYDIRSLRVISGGAASFGARSEALLFTAWLTAQTGREMNFELVSEESEGSEEGIVAVQFAFEDGSFGTLRADRERGVVVSRVNDREVALRRDGALSHDREVVPDCVTRSLARRTEDLVVRLLQRPEADQVYLKTLHVAARLKS